MIRRHEMTTSQTTKLFQDKCWILNNKKILVNVTKKMKSNLNYKKQSFNKRERDEVVPNQYHG
jgi:hypothetical protein